MSAESVRAKSEKAKDAATERVRRETKARGGIRSDKASKQTHKDKRERERERERERARSWTDCN